MVKVTNLFKNLMERFRQGPRLGYKICEAVLSCGDEVIWRPCLVTLEIPAQATIVYPLVNTNKRRCDFAKVIGIDLLAVLSTGHKNWEMIEVHSAYAFYVPSVYYSIGDMIYCNEPLSKNLFMRCASGIHFFDTEDAAFKYCINNHRKIWSM